MQGFEAVKECNPKDKRIYTVWRISDKAMAEGIRSTTRYRKVSVPKRVATSQLPSPRRQKSGAKGGRRTAVTFKLRRLKGEQIIGNPSTIPERISQQPPKNTPPAQVILYDGN
jgi:hypothetical protein